MKNKNLQKYLSRRFKGKAIKVEKKENKKNSNIWFSPLFLQNKNNFDGIIEADWSNVTFQEGQITIKHNDDYFIKSLEQSKEYLNLIKHYYDFHNIQKLVINIKSGQIIEIINEEILFYHIEFLKSISHNFGFDCEVAFSIHTWKQFTKKFYLELLPLISKTDTLNYLCEISCSEFPIVPVGEVLVNNYGKKEIHMSFLFPIKSKSNYLIVWESIIDSKASYVFGTTNYKEDIQSIYNYISSRIKNKRFSLINSKIIQNELKLNTRILHHNIESWKSEIDLIIGLIRI